MPPADDGALTAALARAGRALRPAAADWTATLALVVRDGEDRTLRIEAGTVQVERGTPLRRTARFEASADTWIAVLEGRLPVDEAFRDGHLRADQPAVLLRFARAFDWVAARAGPSAPVAVVRPWPLPPPAAGPPPVGRRYDGGCTLIRAEAVLAYARAVDDPNPAYEGPGALAPPMFHARLVRDLLFAIMLEPDLHSDLRRVLHAGHDVTFHRPLVEGQLVRCSALLESVARKRSGALVTALLHGLVEGELSFEARTRFFLRDPAAPPDTRPAASGPPDRPQPDRPQPDLTLPVALGPDQARTYAAASLDDNPLHLDPDFARQAGYPDVLVHGLCTMAHAAARLVDALAGGDPRRLHRLSLRWARPVYGGQRLLLRAWRTEQGATFELTGPDDQPVVVEGRAWLR